MGADEGIILSDDAFAGSDSLATAYILAQAIQKLMPSTLSCAEGKQRTGVWV